MDIESKQTHILLRQVAPIHDLSLMDRFHAIVVIFLMVVPGSAAAQISIPDSLKSAVSSKFNTDSLNLSREMDSLRNAGKPIQLLQARMDSLTNKKDQLFSETERKKEQLLSGTKTKLEKWKSDAQSRLPRTGVEMPAGVGPTRTT
jgi:hypothetical protein